MSIDHTRDFQAIAARLAAAAPASASLADSAHAGSSSRSLSLSSASASDPPSRSTFLRAVGELSRDLHACTAHLAQLTRLVRRRGGFDDRSDELESMTVRLTSDLKRTHDRLSRLESLIAQRRSDVDRAGATPGSPLDRADLLSSVHGLTHASAIVASLRNATLATTAGFKSTMGGIKSSPAEVQVDLGRPVSTDEVVNVGMAPFAPVQVALSGEALHARSRALDVRVLEGHMAEISALFTRLSSLVAEQGEAVDRLEDNIAASANDVEAGTSQLTRAYADASSSRTLVLRVSALLVLAVILFVLFGL